MAPERPRTGCGLHSRELRTVHAIATPEWDGETDPLSQAVRQGIAELRRRNALVVAGVRVLVGFLELGFHLLGGSIPGHAGAVIIIPAHLGYIAFSIAGAWLLHRRWRVTAVAVAAAAVDVALVSVAVFAVTGHVASIAPLGYLLGILLLLLMFGALALPARLAFSFVGVVLALHLVLGLRAGVPHGFLFIGTVCAATFAAIALWVTTRMVKLAAGMAVTQATASMAARHARALEAAHGELAAQRDRLVAAQGEAEALAQVIVHDLKNPLAALLQYVSLAETELKTVPGAAGLMDYLEHASAEGNRLSKLIGDLLLVYRLERGAMAPACEQVPLALVLLSVVRRHALRAEERGVVVEVEGDEDLMVTADLDLLQRMLENLLSNALRHVGRGDRVKMDARVADGQVRIAVRNSGPPVAGEVRGRLFHRFVTGGRREWQNAGLGLYLCRLVAEAHGGSIALQDAPGWNVSFEVSLPVGASGDKASVPAPPVSATP